MTTLVPVNVDCYSGHKADEYPKCFYLNDELFIITEIIDRWYQGDANPEFPPADYFKITTFTRKQFILKHDLKDERWYAYI
ncbi:MAG: cytoplasmic protein [Bacteroidales bacterium]|nr:cytoplasmic protein [Bacteroidales bacterium]